MQSRIPKLSIPSSGSKSQIPTLINRVMPISLVNYNLRIFSDSCQFLRVLVCTFRSPEKRDASSLRSGIPLSDYHVYYSAVDIFARLKVTLGRLESVWPTEPLTINLPQSDARKIKRNPDRTKTKILTACGSALHFQVVDPAVSA